MKERIRVGRGALLDLGRGDVVVGGVCPHVLVLCGLLRGGWLEGLRDKRLAEDSRRKPLVDEVMKFGSNS